MEFVYRYSENPLNAMKEFYLYARSLMGVELNHVVLNMDGFGGQYREIVDWLRTDSTDCSVLRVKGNNKRLEELQYVLDMLKFKNGLKVFVNTIEKLPLRIPDHIEELGITYGSWITLEYIMSLNMRKLSFLDTHLTNQEINEFYKSWIELKCHQNLESFEINLTNREDFVAIGLRDIPYEMGPTIHIHAYNTEGGSFEVTRNDGLTAFICVIEYQSKFIAIMYTQLSKVA
ncbi:hypothetical protein B9Z55_011313 [Caenorhabditis nigoni]|uniref:Sdz-33 F-box domain-containing protein n=1 Tax=Caenorhabditis nigoni TaxID=1611254 RepID=A0A2G5UJU8_9PELO|nr:hypothetical protein B9Z55_011313 [Caenorhabditis nigoni]